MEPEDIFRETACLIDFLMYSDDVDQRTVDNLWVVLINDIRKWKNDADDRDKMLVAGSVFMIARAALLQHSESRFCDGIHDMLDNTLERNFTGFDEQEQKNFLCNIRECSQQLSEWINHYEDADEWLSDEIEKCMKKKSSKAKDEEQAPAFQPTSATFSKGAGVVDGHITLVYRELLREKWISQDTPADDFLEIFSGRTSRKTVMWMRAKGYLRIFISRLLDEELIICPEGYGYQTIASSHFIDIKGNYMTDLDSSYNSKKAKQTMDNIIESIRTTL